MIFRIIQEKSPAFKRHYEIKNVAPINRWPGVRIVGMVNGKCYDNQNLGILRWLETGSNSLQRTVCQVRKERLYNEKQCTENVE